MVAMLACAAHAQRPLRHVLFDFEAGIEGWSVNVWGGGGEVELSPAGQPKFGSGALHSEIIAVEKGGNTLAPRFGEPGEWRDYDWGRISLWFRGDGSPTRLSFRLFTGTGDEATDQGYSLNLPMDSTEWRHIAAPLSAFWNRAKVPMDTRRIAWSYMGMGGTHSFEIDQIALEAPQRPVALEHVGAAWALPVEPEMAQFADGRYGLRLDPTALMPGPATVSARFDLPGVSHEATQELPAGPARDEVFLVAPASAETGTGVVEIAVTRGGQTTRARWEFDVIAAQPLPDPTQLSLLPAPKEIELGEGVFPLIPGPSPVCTSDAIGSPAVRLLGESLTSWGARGEDLHGIPRAGDRPHSLRIGAPMPLDDALAARLRDLPEEGYVLGVSAAGAEVAANDLPGLRNGVLTLLQAAESHYALTGELAVPAMEVVDWPSLAVRAVSLPLPSNRWGHPNDPPADPNMFLRFMREVVVNTKLNMAVIIIHQAMQYESHPQVAGPAAWSRQDIKRVFDTLRSWAVEPVPHMNSLGHANWLTIPYRDLGIAEDGDVHQICTSHPDSARIMLEIYQEIIDLVQPRYFHVGLDEIRWQTHTLPEEERCSLCAGRSKQDIFVEWVAMLRDFLADQGIEMMMWGDMILPGHNGGPPHNLAETVDRLPKNTIICNWSTGLAPDSHEWFLDRGFERIIKSNSRGANLAEQQVLLGNMFGCWYKVPWLVEGTLAKLEGNAYGSFLEAAEYSWNHWPDMFTIMPPLTAEFFAERPLVQWRIGVDPVPGAGAVEPIALGGTVFLEGLPREPIDFGYLHFPERGGAVWVGGGDGPSTELGRPARALYFLHGAVLDDRDAMVEALKDPQHWDGVPIGEYVVAYASGETATIPVRYGMEVRDPQEGWCIAPIAYSSLAVSPITRQFDGIHLYAMQWINPRPDEFDGIHLYAMQWINPRPDDPIARVTPRAIDAPAGLVLAGLAAQ